MRWKLVSRWCAGAVLAAMVGLAGCVGGPDWPEQPAVVYGAPAAPEAVEWHLGRQGERYVQKYRDGLKRELLFDADGDGRFERVTDLDALDPREIRHVFVLLDGIPYGLIREMYDEGAFRLFHPPARMIAPFPSITDVSYATMFGVTGTSNYESVIYDPKANALYGPYDVYLRGDNELWATSLDYRQSMWIDGVAYLMPMWSTRREFGAMFRRADETLDRRPQQANVLVYSVSTDAAAHMAGWENTRQLLRELDRYLERLVHDGGGQVGLVMLADHGNNFVPDCQRVPVQKALERAGWRVISDRGFERPDEVLLPQFGLVSLMRLYAQTYEQRDRLADLLLTLEGVEHVMWRRGDIAYVRSRAGLAAITRHVPPDAAPREEYFHYEVLEGDDPLCLQALLSPLPTHAFDGRAYYAGDDLLPATADHVWPDPIWRIWHGLDDHATVIPDLAASLAPGYYFGSHGLDRLTGLNGTHGGLRDVDTITFFASTMFAPPPLMRTVDVGPLVNRYFPWVPPVVAPCGHGAHGVHKYLVDQQTIGQRHLE